MAELLHAILGWFAVRWGRTLLLCTVCGAGFKGGFLKHYRYTDTQDIRGFRNLLPDMLASWLQNCQGPRTTAWILSEDAEAIKNMWFWYIFYYILTTPQNPPISSIFIHSPVESEDPDTTDPQRRDRRTLRCHEAPGETLGASNGFKAQLAQNLIYFYDVSVASNASKIFQDSKNSYKSFEWASGAGKADGWTL